MHDSPQLAPPPPPQLAPPPPPPAQLPPPAVPAHAADAQPGGV